MDPTEPPESSEPPEPPVPWGEPPPDAGESGFDQSSADTERWKAIHTVTNWTKPTQHGRLTPYTALGVVLALWALPILLALSPPEIGQFTHVELNRQVLLFSLLISLGTGLLFGLAPALFASRSDPNESLREGERGS